MLTRNIYSSMKENKKNINHQKLEANDVDKTQLETHLDVSSYYVSFEKRENLISYCKRLP
jgi:predicted rRNA methylase YqxC with S4 and FtsJ domains